MSARRPQLNWRHSEERLGVLEADVDGAYHMEVQPDEDDVAWQVWYGPNDEYDNGNEPTIERAQCMAELFALNHARGVVAKLEPSP